MNGRKNQLQGNLLAFLLLFSVSLYRQLSLRYLPNDAFRTYILYGCYVILLVAWGVSIWSRVAQRDMMRFLLVEDLLMFIGLTTRFVQDTFLSDNIPALRITGLFLATMLLPMMTLGLYACMCIGEGNGFRIPRKQYLLLIPSLVLIPLLLTDNYHHFFTYIIPEEPQPNLTYHPYVGFYVVFVLILAAAGFRVYQIYIRNDFMKDRPILRRLIPFVEPILLVIFYLPYIINWLRINAPLAPVEVIEQYAKIYSIENLSWELFIYLGFVPVNTDYRAVFEQSTIGMQILCDNGERILSANAPELPEQTMDEKTSVQEYAGMELHMHRIHEANVLWMKDISLFQDTIIALNRSAEELAQEGVLLSEELRAKNEEASLTAKNQIYDSLSREMQPQLQMVKQICQAQGRLENRETGLRQLIILGTYMKRRCNLRLIEQENGHIENEDFHMSFADMLSAIRQVGIEGTLEWLSSSDFSTRFGIAAFDFLETLLERIDFSAQSFSACVTDRTIVFSVSGAAVSENLPNDFDTLWETTDDGFRVTMREEGACACQS